jgi:hypothetical protein
MTGTDELGQLRAENALLRQAAALWQAQVATVQAALAVAQEQIAQLQTEVVRLQAERDQQKGPPAFVKGNTPAAAARGPRKKRAAAHNHARRRAEPTQIIYHVLEHCPDCGYQLRGGHEVWRRQIIELPAPAPVEVSEHRILTRHCPACDRWQTPQVDFGGQVVGQGRRGVRLLSLLVYLRVVGRLPLRTIQQYLATVHGLRLSVGGLVEALHTVRRATQPAYDALKAQARASPVVHMDETGWREGGQNGYVWTLATPGPRAVRIYEYDHSRAGRVARTLLGQFSGYLVTDFYGAYNNYSAQQQRCWGHFLRDLHALRVDHVRDAEVRRFVRRVMALYRLGRWAVRRPLPAAQRVALAQRLDKEAQRLGLRYAQHTGHPCQTLARRLLRHQGELFAFVHVEGLAPDNNLAERAVRPVVITRKISGGTKSPEGSATRLTLASLCATWLARGLNPFHACLALLRGESSLMDP